MLRIEHVTVRYGTLPAVDGVDLALPDGQVLGLLGPSGCGKSTLLRAVAGLEPLTAGRITLDDVDLAGVAVHRRGFGLMFQDGVLFPHRTVSGNIGYGLHGLPRAAVAARVLELLDLVGLAGAADRPVGTLSGGQAQRVALARALAPNPRLLLLDEPLAALDRSLRERLLDDLRRILRTTGTTTIFVTHDQAEAFAIADTVALMQAGSIRQSGTPLDVWRHPADRWVAEFVGYSSFASGQQLLNAGADLDGSADRVALRPSALVVDQAGSMSGRVLGSWPTPDGHRIQVDVSGLGPVQALTDHAELAVGELVRLRLEPDAVAPLPVVE